MFSKGSSGAGRRAVLLFATTVTALVLGSGVALAAGDYCTSNPCYGTSEADVLLGTPDGETIEVFGSNDFVKPLEGEDTVYGGRGNDRISVVDGYKDVVDCGPGSADTVYYDPGLDTVKKCENKHPNIPIVW